MPPAPRAQRIDRNRNRESIRANRIAQARDPTRALSRVGFVGVDVGLFR
jgi:hypothetical protein